MQFCFQKMFFFLITENLKFDEKEPAERVWVTEGTRSLNPASQACVPPTITAEAERCFQVSRSFELQR